MLNILVLGSTGMAGHVITTYFIEQNIHNITNLAHRKKLNKDTVIFDVTNLAKFDNYLNERHFDIIINCIGVLNQNADEEKAVAVLLNSYLPHFLENKYKNSNTKIIHLSTDCVFSGNLGQYREDSFKDGNTFYDRTKAIGEIYSGRNLTFRTSIIGPDHNLDGIGLFNWFMNSKRQVDGYSKVIWTGITTIELARCIDKAIEKDLTGLYHLVPKESIDKYTLLSLFKETFNRHDIIINKSEKKSLDKSLINTRTDFDYNIPTYNEMIKDMKLWINKHQYFYKHYDIV